jgi:hypothetical protein
MENEKKVVGQIMFDLRKTSCWPETLMALA